MQLWKKLYTDFVEMIKINFLFVFGQFYDISLSDGEPVIGLTSCSQTSIW